MKLVINSLSKTYANGVHALKDVSLTLNNGMFGLLGPNGAGKSSLMRTIATLQEADKGSIFLDELDVLKNKTEVRQLLGYLPQEFGVYPKISAERMLDHIAQLKGVGNNAERKDLVLQLLENVNLYKDRKKHLGTYSGGMKQRFGIAQALIGNPKLIIVDEPTAGLDPAERNRFYNLLSRLGENTIVILSTHIVEDVSTLCANFAIICQGEVLYAGDPESAVNELNGKIYSKVITQSELGFYKDDYQVISTQLKTGKLHIRIINEADPGNGFISSTPNLEDVYFSNIATRIDVDTI
ncbi:ABC transporter ATP-binding protein [Mucilaginibacter rubeus]|uniref:ABC transporter ATP-binding protein n=3 Tax=Mucilaginibacter TaxID=423349 RepID=A0AAE6JFL6_9SPHI|nr:MULTISPECIES: ABC transporter ATP-binding protein [Mucilaginibacter]QEM04463.1 ABC transporter ATP-binding protein [Mucilaginibacter rubeus]QEM17059.1 ABC transporter ATP-binding protein [Mucilaginibacter gossypii]QTE37952.1 ABC transporter ATP-binding protein [Mucilaginibacter gossypii]QTE46443.1 ABC transporter ATP-binding protein [Mucilaginibacter rubeus]QTE53040.1 ABC transporter ATP-binding protein [Mucilaginibacter rubeus]